MTNAIAKLHYDHLVAEMRRFTRENRFTSVLLGVSGGIDSALVATIAADALGGPNVHGISMPSRFSSDHSKTDAEVLMANLGGTYRVVEIGPMYDAFMASLKLEGVAGENLQARIRGTILMSVSNMEGHLVLATGNRSEALMGYCTMYGDTVGGFAPLAAQFKTGVYDLARYRNSFEDAPIPVSTLTKPPSAELAPGQKDSDSLPDYDVLDRFLMAYVGGMPSEALAAEFGADFTENLLRKIRASEWKRRQLPPGPNPLIFNPTSHDRRS